VPIVLIKIGKTEEGQAAVAAHTAHVTGSDVVHDAVFEQTGIIRVDDLDEVIEFAGMFCHLERPLELRAGGAIAIYALSGGTASHMADLCSAAGLSIPRLEQSTIDKLHEHIPIFLRVDNPIDSGGTISALPAGRVTLDDALADPNIDLLIAPITGVYPGMSDGLAKDLIELHQQWLDPAYPNAKPVVAVWSSPIRDDDAYRALCAAGVPLFHSFNNCAMGIAALVKWSRYVADYHSAFDNTPTQATAARGAARELLAGVGPGGSLNEVSSKNVLRSYGIATVPEAIVTSGAEAGRAIATMGAAAMKIVSADIAHKSDFGLVMLNITNAAQAKDAYAQLMERAGAACPDALIDGVVMQEMISDGVVEALLGISQQAPFGPTVVAGLGGVFVEVLSDVSFGVPPFTNAYAAHMVRRLRGLPLLMGARGRPEADIDALVQAIMSLQRLALEIGDDIESIDINPLIVRPKGLGVMAVDALIVAKH
jgi:acyl-CoA synthetase (NDP forming)